ncbi:hypothetical protein OQA88_13037 [Cercophora sp. LCS_1]
MADINLVEIHDALVALAFEAGRMILAADPSSISTGSKMNSADIVTETDRAVEALISARLRTLYPTHAFIGEETYVPGTTVLTPDPTFIVDPIDGTTNFVHGFPNACISLGFVLSRLPSVGVVYNPFQDLLFTGIKGQGSYMTRNASRANPTKQRLPLAGVDKPDGTRTGHALGDLSTGIHAPPTLHGEIHPVFRDWIIPNDNGEAEALGCELRQPLLLASRILESVGLPWLSEFCIDNIFAPTYPGQSIPAKPASNRHRVDRRPPMPTPEVIVRHHRASWATPHLANGWLSATAHELRAELPRSVRWQLDPDIFSTFGWVGYTCRRRAQNRGTMLTVDEASKDRPHTIMAADKEAKAAGATSRCMTILVMKEYASRLHMLRRLGRVGDEEYLLTAFMAAVTMLHELGHAIYWRDFRVMNPRMTEPYFGSDLEMELGDSFIASIFGGWIPVPIETEDRFPLGGTFEKDFEGDEGGRLCCWWKRKPAADFRIPLYQTTLLRHAEDSARSYSCRMVPDEPEVPDKAMSRVMIRLELPNSEIASCRKPRNMNAVPPLPANVTPLQDVGDWEIRGVGLDLRMMTGDGLRASLANALNLPSEHVKLRLVHSKEENREGNVLGSCMLSAYARQVDGDVLALRLSLDPE